MTSAIQVGSFITRKPPPVAFISFDLDLYASTKKAMRLRADAPVDLFLPRVHCYFDDILGFTYASFNAQRLAIDELNSAEGNRWLSPIHGLRFFVPRRFRMLPWTEQYFLAHILDHPRYAEPDDLLPGRVLPS